MKINFSFLSGAYVVLKKITGGEYYLLKADSLGFNTSDDICDYFKTKEPVPDSDSINKFYSVVISYGDFDICNNILERLKRFREDISGSANESPPEGNIEEEPGMDLTTSKSEESARHFQASINMLEKRLEKIEHKLDEVNKMGAENTNEILNIQSILQYDQSMEQDSDGQAYFQQTFDSHFDTNVQDDSNSVNDNNNSSTENNQNVSDLLQAEKSNSIKNNPENPRSKRKRSFGEKELLNILETGLVKAQQKVSV